jgi:hypothetical protein
MVLMQPPPEVEPPLVVVDPPVDVEPPVVVVEPPLVFDPPVVDDVEPPFEQALTDSKEVSAIAMAAWLS